MNTYHIHFIGIGGIGMSALALIAKEKGSIVSGCDTNLTQQTITNLIEKGCNISLNHGNELCFDSSITLIVYSTGTQQTMAEKVTAQHRGIHIVHRAELLSYFMSSKIAIAVTGAHGKTTTSAMISHIFLTLQLNPTCVIGGIFPSINSNAVYGNGKFFIAEADESDRSFVHLPAAIKLITNIDFEHVETYANIDDIKNTCLTFLHAFQERTIAQVVCIDNEHIRSLLPHIKVPYKTYGIDEKADLRVTNIHLLPFSSHFTIYCKQNNQSINCTLPMSGIHNVVNAAGAVCVAHVAGIDLAQAALTLSTFKGVDRRFTIRGYYNKALVIDDYAHHPEEIRKTIAAAKGCISGKLYVVYQPHRFTRTVGLWNDFVDLWQKTDTVNYLLVTDIYGAGEQMTVPVSSKQLVSAINKYNCHYIKNEIRSIQQAFNNIQLTSDDLILFLGAGDISLQSIALTRNAFHSESQAE
jgi:UDP-N-acetylmuramate--alanine ligase